MPNLRVGFVTIARFPASMTLFTSELLAERVAPVQLDGSTMVEGTVCPTIASSPDVDIRGILATGLEKAKHKSVNRIKKYSTVKQLATYLSLVIWEELRRFLAKDRVPLGCPVWVSVLGVGLSSLSLLSPASSSSVQSKLYISIICMKSHMNILRFD